MAMAQMAMLVVPDWVTPLRAALLALLAAELAIVGVARLRPPLAHRRLGLRIISGVAYIPAALGTNLGHLPVALWTVWW